MITDPVFRPTAQQLDRAVGSVVGMAVGDALGSQYEFGPDYPAEFVPEFGVGQFGHGSSRCALVGAVRRRWPIA